MTGGHDDRGSAAPVLGHVLPVGTRLADYEILDLIGEGGFGIVYLATDHSLERRVALKEYMPAAIASRVTGSSRIVVKSERHGDTFRAGLRSFVNEARLLARFDHPALVKVFRFWEANGTAYMVMPFYEGPTLKAALAALGRPPTEDELRAWLAPLVDALAVLHAAHCFHRDIAPDNILLTRRGPLLLDFGAARRVIGDMTQALTVVLKPGFAPIEQYGEAKSMAQGAWTDFYALASVVRFAITGTPPVSAVERLMDDRLEPLAEVARGRYSARFLEGVDRALAVRPHDRPQDADAFRAALDLPEAAPVAIVTVPAALDGAADDDRRGHTTPGDGAFRATGPATGGWVATAADEVPPVLARTEPWRPPGPVAKATAPVALEREAREATPTRSAMATRAAIPFVALPAPARPAGLAPGTRSPGGTPAPEAVPSVPRPGTPPAATATAAATTRPAALPPRSEPERRTAVWPWVAAGTVGVLLVGGLVVVLDRPERSGSSATAASSAIATPRSASASPSAPAPAPAPAPMTDPAPAPMPSTAPAAVPEPPAARPAPATVPAPSPTPAPATPRSPAPAPAPTIRTPAVTPPATAARASDGAPPAAQPAAPAVRRPGLEPPSADRGAAPRERPPRAAAGERCSDILRKGSLEPLTADESAYLRRDCR